MATRSYGDTCGIARALDAVGDRWTLLVVRELVHGPKRYTELQAGLGRIGPDVLAQRLRELETAGLVERATDPGPGRARVYALTDDGRRLEPVLHALGRFGSALPVQPDARALSVDAAVVALETTFRPARAAGVTGTVVLTLDGEPFTAAVADGGLTVDRGTAAAPDASLAASTAVLADLVWRGRPLATAEAEGAVVVEGDRALLERLFGLFEVGDADPYRKGDPES